MLHVFWIFFPPPPPRLCSSEEGKRFTRNFDSFLRSSLVLFEIWGQVTNNNNNRCLSIDLIWNVWIFLSFLFSSTNVFVVVLTRLGSELHRDTCPYFLKKISIFFNWKFSTKCIEEGNSKKIGLNVKREGTVLSYWRVKIHSFVDKICRNKLNENTISLISCRYATLRPDIELHEIQHFFS